MSLRPTAELGARGRAKRAQILSAARELFLERGYERTTIDAIRERADVSKPTLYGHSSGKEQLFAAVVAELVDEIAGAGMADGLPAPTTQAELTDQLRGFLHRAAAGVTRPDYLALLRVIVTEAPRFPELGQLFVEAGPRRGLSEVAALLRGAQERGLVRVADVDVAAAVLLGSLLVHVLVEGLMTPGPQRPIPPARLDSVVDLFLSGLQPDREATRDRP